MTSLQVHCFLLPAICSLLFFHAEFFKNGEPKGQDFLVGSEIIRGACSSFLLFLAEFVTTESTEHYFLLVLIICLFNVSNIIILAISTTVFPPKEALSLILWGCLTRLSHDRHSQAFHTPTSLGHCLTSVATCGRRPCGALHRCHHLQEAAWHIMPLCHGMYKQWHQHYMPCGILLQTVAPV